MSKFKEVKVKSVKFLEKTEKTIDLKIKDVHHYLLKNGVVSHNSTDLFPQAIMSGGEGLMYSASTIVFLGAAKLKTGKEANDNYSTGSSGVLVTARARKNRLAKPKKVYFEIDHSEGTNPFKGLEYFCTPENYEKVGIVKGKVDLETGEIINGSKWYVKHLDKSFFEKDIFNAKVFNKDVLNALEPIIYDYFKYASFEEMQQEIGLINDEYSEYEKDLDKDEISEDELFDKE